MTIYSGAALAVLVGATPIPTDCLRSVELTKTADVHDSTGASNTERVFLPGHLGYAARIDLWDLNEDASLRTILDVPSAVFTVHPQGPGLGLPVITFTGVITGLTLGVAHDGVAPLSVAIQVTGAVDEGVGS